MDVQKLFAATFYSIPDHLNTMVIKEKSSLYLIAGLKSSDLKVKKINVLTFKAIDMLFQWKFSRY